MQSKINVYVILFLLKRKGIVVMFSFFFLLQSGKIRTVIKTPQMWGNVLNTRQALFTVTKDLNYLSLITMIGPSPDWCLGKFISEQFL